jgi:CSLREA domain-containing protein
MLGLIMLAVPQSAAAATFTVNSTVDSVDASPGNGTCADSLNRCTLRAAIMESNASGSGPNFIIVPAGTYNLTLGPADDEFNFDGAEDGFGDLDIFLNDLTITGAGAGATIIDAGEIDRVFDINNFSAFANSVNVVLQGLTIRGGNAATTPEGYHKPGGGIQFDGTDNNTGFPTGSLTVTNCQITSNSASGPGGGILSIFGSLTVTGSTISSNTTVNASGGGILFDGSSASGLRSLLVTNSSITSNVAANGVFGNGAGILGTGNATKTIRYNVITNNSAGVRGGGVNNTGSLDLTYNVIVGNSAGVAASNGLHSNSGVVTSDNDWWGCNQGPSTTPCDRASGPLGFGVTQWLTLSHTATPSSILTNQSTTLQADFYTNNLASAIAAADLVALNGRTVTFNNAVLGTISGADPTIQNGKANATFTAGAVGGNGSADATVDHATVTASISISEPAAVTTNPTDQTACDGASVSFTASASGFPTPTVQWQVSTGGPFSDIPGATSTTLTFTATAAQNGNQYRAVFTNSGGTATTTAATLTVNTAPAITTNPANQTVCAGATATFTAAASGSPAATVQWQVSTGGPFSNIPGATSTTLSFAATTAQNGNSYRAVFTNSCSTATTTAATLTVNANTTTTDPPDQTVCENVPATFATTAGGTGPFHYAWTVDTVSFGGDTASITIPANSLSPGNHTVAVTTSGACGTASQSATLTINPKTATTDPPDRSVCVGATTTFTTAASGTGPFTYVWKQGATVLTTGSLGGRVTITSVGNTSSLTITNVQLGDAAIYTVETTACSTASQSAMLSINPTPPGIVLNGNNIQLWPPNHSYHTINVTDLVAGASSCDGTVNLSSVVIDYVTSDEVENGNGDGNTLNDIVIGCDRKSVQLRAERDGSGNGRVYTLHFKVTDSFGNVGTAMAVVTVPKNQNGSPAVDSGGHYTVTNPTCP